MPHPTAAAAPSDTAPRPAVPKKLVVGITGASGAAYAQHLCTTIHHLGHELHIVITDYGKRLLIDELGPTGPRLETLCSLELEPGQQLDPRDAPHSHGIYLHPLNNVGATLGSGSFRHDGMAIVPCSSNTLGAIANGYGDHLLHRAAAVCLKERFPLVIAHREAPLNRVDLKNMLSLHDAGATICPTNPGFYFLPESIDEIIAFMTARFLDCLGVEHRFKRWGDHES
ncbi:MAG: UbiX family flavin prenyltransferase [Planctomycetota bacterium]